ncbi:MAG: hypothetical protein I8H75_00910 [Myxococcaceae bacterium]|nr:hypothetical protein [Myxococcaceae bacterium]MBH2005901.1 hypothetical protein [Myxococcaceae bacterium]
MVILFILLFCLSPLAEAQLWTLQNANQPYVWCDSYKNHRWDDWSWSTSDPEEDKCRSRLWKLKVENFGASNNPCFKEIWGLLEPQSGTVSFVNVSMAYIQDMSIAKRLVALAGNGAKIFVQQNAKPEQNSDGQDNFCAIKVREFFKSNEGIPNFSWALKNLGEYNLYHPKILQVTHVDEGGVQQHFLLQGSYNFNPAAWKSNVEVITILKNSGNPPLNPLLEQPSETLGEWTVLHPLLDCLPQNVRPLAWNDLHSAASYPPGNAVSPGYKNNRCFRMIYNLLNPEDKTHISVEVKTGYFEDKKLAQMLKTLIDQGVSVSVEADQSKISGIDSEAIRTEINELNAKKKNPDDPKLKRLISELKKIDAIQYIKTLLGENATFYDKFPSGGIYHPKYMKVMFEKKEADEKTYVYTYIIVGSYNFTVAAWRLNQESMTVLLKKEEKKKQEKPAVLSEALAATDAKKLEAEFEKLEIPSFSQGVVSGRQSTRSLDKSSQLEDVDSFLPMPMGTGIIGEQQKLGGLLEFLASNRML